MEKLSEGLFTQFKVKFLYWFYHIDWLDEMSKSTNLMIWVDL